MTESLNRKIARRYSKAVSNENFRSDGTLLATATVYDSTADLPTSGIERGAQGYVSSNQRLYIRGTGGWYNIATINNTPTINSVQTAGGDSSPFTLATDGSTTTVITITATDTEGFPITFSATTDVGFDSIATVSNDSSVFTITPLSEDSAGTATSGTLTFKASDGVNIASEVATFTIVFKVDNSAYTVFLVKGSGNNKTNDAAPTDAKSNTVTSSGTYNTAKSPYSRRSVIFRNDAAGTNYIRADAALDSLTSTTPDCTFEGWYYINSAGNTTFEALFGCNAANDGDNILIAAYKSNKLEIIYNKQTTQVSTKNIPVGEWFYLTVTLDSSDGLRAYINGQLYISDTVETLHAALSACDFLIGAEFDSNESVGNYLNGYVSDFRISNTVRYNSQHGVPIRYLETDSNTIFHILGSSSRPLVVDQSSNALDINDGSSSAIVKGGYNRILDVVNIPPHADHGGHSFDTGSIYFDGTNDYVRCDAALDSFTSTTDPWTIEAWVFNSHNDDNTYWLGINTASGGTNVILWRSGGRLEVDTTNYTPSSDEETGTMWSHRLATFDGTTVYLYINGKLITSGANAPNTALASCVLLLGAEADAGDGGGLGNWWQGYISDFRIRSSYTSSVTVPTSPLSTTGDTVFHLKGNDAGVYDAARGRILTLNGNTKSSTAQTKNAASSIVFDGNGDTITSSQQVPRNETDDWTIEFWTRPNNVTNRMDMFSQYANTVAGRMTINMNNSGILNFFQNGLSPSSISSSSSLSANTWHHVAVTNNGGTRSMWLDGNYQGNSTGSQAIADSTIMIGNAVDRTDYMNGYMEDIRLSDGLARYPFIPFKTTLSNDSNTDFLTGHAATIVDGSSNSRTITSSGAAVSNYGPFTGMKSIYFDGVNDTMVVPAAAWDRDADYTVECWAYPTAYNYIAMSRNRRAADGIIFSFTSDGYIFFGSGRDNVDQWDLTHTGSVDYRNQWNHFALTYDASEKRYRIFVNGAPVFTGTSAYHPGSLSSDFNIGCSDTMNDGQTQYGQGHISNHRISNIIRYTTSFTPPTTELKA